VLTVADVVRELGLTPVPIPGSVASAAARAAAMIPRLPFLPPATEWVEAAAHPAIMDTAKAKRELGWRPTYTALEALRDTLPR
jgi:nucleoside-diphosphate-sugar epimerase